MKTKTLIFALFTGITISSCSDFLTQLPETSVPKENFYKTEADFAQANIGIYQMLRSIYGAGAANYGSWMMGEMRSDNTTYLYNLENRGYADREYVALFTDDANGGAVSNKYNNTYYMIQRANQVIQYIEEANISESAYRNYKGQALFLRALGYFDLVQYFGGVPLITVAPTSYGQTMVPRNTVEEVYNQIITDATEAANILPPVTEQQKGYASQGSAYTLLGNVYIVLKRWAEAETALKKVTGYTLLDDYASIYDPSNKNHAESIFEIQYWDDQAAGQQSDFAYNFLPILSNPGLIEGFPDGNTNNYAGWNIPTPEMIAAYEPGDKRKEASIGFFTGDPAHNYIDFPYVKKYVHGAVQAGYCNDNWPVYRYSDCLLLLAECLVEQGRTAEAVPYVNQVRNRAGLPSVTTVNAKIVADERRHELAFENHRWYDLIRTGMAIDVMTEYGKYIKSIDSGLADRTYQIKGDYLLYPIPYREIQLNNQLTQNPGYN